MGKYDKRYTAYLTGSVKHIFENFFGDSSIDEIFETQATDEDFVVSIEISGAFRGELMIHLPEKTLFGLTASMTGKKGAELKKYAPDIAGELANLVCGTFANQLQYCRQFIILSPPSINEPLISIKTIYENISLSFSSSYGGFDLEFYYRDPGK